MSWVYLLFAVWLLAGALNARAPRRGRLTLAPSFFWSWITIELVWHQVAFAVVVTLGFLTAGWLDTTAGVVGLAVAAVALVLHVAIGLRARTTLVSVRGALEELEPDDDAPRFPRSHVVVPALLNRRRGVSRVRNVTFAAVAGKRLRLDVTVPSAPPPGGGRRPALLQVHGGAWVLGDKREQGLPLLNHMATCGWVGFNVNYRLSPAATFPEHLVDLKRGLAWIREHADEWDVDPDFVVVTGGSAGGHLAALMGLTAGDPRFQPGFEAADTSLAAAVPFYGVYDFTKDGSFGRQDEIYRMLLEPYVMKAFYDEAPERYREASPIHHVHPDAPPFLVVHGDNDTLTPVEDARRFVEALRAVSRNPVLYAEMQGAQHAFDVFPSYRTARVVEGVERFLTTLHQRSRREDEGTESLDEELEDELVD